MDDIRYSEMGQLIMAIMRLVSIGEEESLDTVVEHLEKEDIYEFLSEKYRDKFTNFFCVSNLNVMAINSMFNQNANSKEYFKQTYGIVKENDGLLLIVSLIAQKLVYCK